MKSHTHQRVRHALCHGVLLVASAVTIRAEPDYSAPYYFTTLAGAASQGSADGAGSAARFSSPYGVAVDMAGNVYVADRGNHTIRKITPSGLVSTLAGSAGNFGATDGASGAARFRNPAGVAVDAGGTLYVADTGNGTIRRISPAGMVSTLAGSAGLFGDDDGMGQAARFRTPVGIAVDAGGTLYVADTEGNAIRKITAAGVVSTLNGTTSSGLAVQFIQPQAVTVDPLGNVFFVGDADGWTAIHKITPAGVVTFVERYTAQEPVAYPYGHPRGLAIDARGTLYVASAESSVIYKVTPEGDVTTWVGSGEGSADGVEKSAQLYHPAGLAFDGSGNLHVADRDNNTIRRITPGGAVTTLAGVGYWESDRYANGPGAAARFKSDTFGAATGPAGEVYVCARSSCTIRVIMPDGEVRTFAGQEGLSGNVDGTGSAARFVMPHDLAVDAHGVVYVIDAGKLRKITPAGVVTTLSLSTPDFPEVTTAVFPPTAGSPFRPYALAVDPSGDLYVLHGNSYDLYYGPVSYNTYTCNTVCRVTPAGNVSVVAGDPTKYARQALVDGAGRAAQFYSPSALAVDAWGTIYVKDNGTIRKITPGGLVTTWVGKAGMFDYVDGAGEAARFWWGTGLAVDEGGTVYVTEPYLYTVRRVTPAGVVSTLAGLPGYNGSTDGVGPDARFYMPCSVGVDSAGSLFVVDSRNNTIRKGRPAGPPVITTQPQSLSVTAGNNVQFTVIATATPAATYQWYYNGNPFTGETTSTLSFGNARSSDAGDYTVVVSNELGSVTSTKATLTVAAAPAPVPVSTAKSGGGGAINGWFLLALLALAVLRRWRAP